MERFKKWLMSGIAIIGIVLLGYHHTKDFVAFANPMFLDFTFTAAIIVWALMFMIVLKEWVEKNIRDKWKEKNLKLLKVSCATLIAFSVGCTIGNIDLLGNVLTIKELVPILAIPVLSTALIGLKDNKNAGWIGGDPSKGGDIKH